MNGTGRAEDPQLSADGHAVSDFGGGADRRTDLAVEGVVMDGNQLSTADWEYIEQQANMLFGKVRIKFDDFDVHYRLKHISATKGAVVTFVNGEIKGAWVDGKNSFPEQQFMRRRQVGLCKPKERQRIEKALGKHKVKKYYPNIDKKYVYFDPSWTSWRSVHRHIRRIAKGFKSVELIREES